MARGIVLLKHLSLVAVLGLAIVQTPAHGQRRDTMNSTPRTFAGQTTRLYDFPGGALEGRTERRPLRTNRLTYPGASSGDTPRTLSRRESGAGVAGLSPAPEIPRRFNGSATPVNEPDAPPGTPVPIVDPVTRRGFVSVHELLGVPAVSATGTPLGRIETATLNVETGSRGVVIRRYDTPDSVLVVPLSRVIRDRATGQAIVAAP